MILYLGNKLSKHGNTPTSVETLGTLLAEEFDIVTVSDKKNRLLRLTDMLGTIIRHRKQADLVLIDTYSTSNFYYALLSALLCRLLGIAYIPILRGGNLPERLRKNPRLCEMIFRFSKINVAPSGYLHEAFKTAGFAVERIPNSMDIAAYDFLERKALHLRLLYVRAFSKVYNPQMAIRVLHRLLKTYPEAELCMVGPDRDGTLAEVQALASELGVESRVTFTGKMNKAEWIGLSKEYDIFINTTHFDNTPVSVMEAMALGLPVVSTNVGGIPYLIEDGKDGLLVDKDDAKVMSEKIMWLLSEPEKAVIISINARKKAEAFSWHQIKNKWIKVIENCFEKTQYKEG